MAIVFIYNLLTKFISDWSRSVILGNISRLVVGEGERIATYIRNDDDDGLFEFFSLAKTRETPEGALETKRNS